MDLRAILFDVNGTLIDIETDEGQDWIYQVISRFLMYEGVDLTADWVRKRYFGIMDAQRKSSLEPFPEFDAVAIWRTILDSVARPGKSGLDDQGRDLPRFLAELHRTLSHKRLQLYPDVREVLAALGKQYRLGIVSDAQSAYSGPELRTVGLAGLFACQIVSGDYGYRKPDSRLFAAGLTALGVRPDQALYVGNDMYHDVYGAQQAGVRAVFWPTQFGRKTHDGVNPDYVIHSFAQLSDAVTFLAAR